MSSLQAFKDSIDGLVTEPQDPEYSIKRVTPTIERPAKLVVYPRSADAVSKAILYAKAEGLEIAVCGRGYSSTSDSSVAGGVVIDLSKFMNDVRIDPENKLAYAQGGASCETLDNKAIEHGLATATAAVNLVGVGGYTTSGGWGWLSGEHGLIIDNLVSATVVVANGVVLTASETENPDLFWGIRGGGSNFGVVTDFVFRLHPQRKEVYTSFLFYTPDLLGKVVEETNAWLKERSTKEPGGLIMIVGPAGKPVIGFLGIYNGDEDDGRAKYQRFIDIGPIFNDSKSIPFPVLNTLNNASAASGGKHIYREAPSKTLDPTVLSKVFGRWHEIVTEEPDFQTSGVFIELYPPEKRAAVPKDATPVEDREPVYNIGVKIGWQNDNLDAKAQAYTRELTALVSPTAAEEETVLEGSNDDLDARYREREGRKRFGSNYERLQKVKRQYDPENVFHRCLFPITPASA